MRYNCTKIDVVKSKWTSDLGLEGERLYNKKWKYKLYEENNFYVGVYSFARYDPAFYGEERGKNYKKILLWRSCKVLVHEIGHMFGIEHCIFYSCVMNGSNHLKESDARTHHLCPVDLRKLHYSVGFDVIQRYRKLQSFYEECGFEEEEKWIRKRLKNILD